MGDGMKEKGLKKRVSAVILLICMGLTAACSTGGGAVQNWETEGTDTREKQAEALEIREDVVIHVLVTTHAWTKDMEDIPMFRDLSEKPV